MRMYDMIEKKRDGNPLSKDEINYIIREYVNDNIPDYQMSALLMAIYFKGMNKEEVADLTLAFVDSGDKIDLSEIKGIKVDKHSTGGVGDKISLITVPLVASVGVPVAKMSGRGLGHTGGTLDKLEAIDGFRIELTSDEFINNVNNHKMAIIGQTANLTPADKKIYALRDVTATVDSIPLIASSIMSKKIASGSDAIVLDVKVGSGAFMKSLENARELAQTMVDIGKSLNRKTIAVITNMNQPLGHEIGNANEVAEAIEVLRGKGAKDETTIALTIAAYMCVLGGAFDEFERAYKALEEVIKSGKAIDKLKELIHIQGGNPDIVDNPGSLPQAKYNLEVRSQETGYIIDIDAESMGVSAMLLGAGRRKKDDPIDYSAGITLKKKIGDKVEKNEVLCILHTNKDHSEAYKRAESAFSLGANKPESEDYIFDIIM